MKNRKRTPFGSLQQKLAYPERPGFHRHWFNDVPGRITQALEAGYEHVKDDEGKPVMRVVGVAEQGGPLNAYIMEIPEEWYTEDMIAQEQVDAERMDAIRKSTVQGMTEGRDSEKFYAGKEGSSVRR